MRLGALFSIGGPESDVTLFQAEKKHRSDEQVSEILASPGIIGGAIKGSSETPRTA